MPDPPACGGQGAGILTGRAAGRRDAAAPGVVAGAEFTAAFARRLVPYFISEWLVRAAVGGGRSSTLLGGQHVRPRRNLETG